AEGSASRQLQLLFEATSVDPSYLPAVVELYRHPALLYRSPGAAEEINRLIDRIDVPDLKECYTKLFLIRRDIYSDLRDESAPLDCIRFFNLSSRLSLGPPFDERPAIRLWRKYPDVPGMAEQVYSALVLTKNKTLARELGTDMLQSHLPDTRLYGHLLLRSAALWDDNDSLATRFERAANADFANNPGTSLRFKYFIGRLREISLDSLLSVRDPLLRVDLLHFRGQEAYGDGDLVTSERIWRYLAHDFADYKAMHATAVIMLGRTHLKAGRLKAAESTLLDGLKLALRDSVLGISIQGDHNLFHVYEALNDTARALAFGQSYVDRSQVKAFPAPRMMAYHDLGWYYWRLGDYHKANRLLDRMRLLIDTLHAHRHYAGEYYERTGQLDRAIDMYDSAVAIEGGDYRSVARRAVLAAQLGDQARAISLAQMHDTAIGPAYPEFTPQLPTILGMFGLKEKALRAAELATVRATRNQQAAATASLLLQRASLELSLGRPRRAAILADSSIEFAGRAGAYETEALARGTRAVATRAIDTLRALTRSPYAKLQPFLAMQLHTLKGSAHESRGETKQALDSYAAAARLTETLASSLALDADRARYRSAANDVSGRALALAVRSSSVPVYLEWTVRRKARGLERKTRRSRNRPTVREAFVDYVVLDSVVAALVIRNDGSTLHKLPVSASVLSAQIKRLQERLTPRIGSAIDSQRSEFDAQTARLLYEELVKPLDAQLNDVEKLVIIPDRDLNYLPFDALIDPAGHYLLQRFVLRYAPSIDLADKEPAIRQGLVLALPGLGPAADEEVRSIAATSSSRLRVLPIAAHSASEARVRNLAPDASVIHFAMHAAPNDASPAFAYLSLRPQDDDDGRLHAFEVEHLQLRNALVVLSGCDTGRGYLAGGEGVLSLSRAFLRAGASATVATLWPVGYGSVEIMTEFYRQLSAGYTPAEALRAAKLHALKGGYASPLYWAPFVLVGA
ncbi:MAG TPA: CHAT domain-containing protein, partial [Longimicrobiales bacterium]|nr:CHAT domain-containing protein [Longimicrobiales bacterium]